MAGKNIKGRKRTIAVDVMGNLYDVSVDNANIHDVHLGCQNLGCQTIDKIRRKYPKIKIFLADAGYRGATVDYAKSVGCTLRISKKIKDEFAIQPSGG
ncbi:MAG: hypothetical protein ACI9CD_000112 [Candidatus Deianiraeaceae bacterium]|jgi:hypothetical protein